ncbi:hypothetical protein V1506DRAFT_530528 [Lipomyces tetrasporus]
MLRCCSLSIFSFLCLSSDFIYLLLSPLPLLLFPLDLFITLASVPTSFYYTLRAITVTKSTFEL